MTKEELLAAARSGLYDTATPYLWSDAELTEYLADAEREAAERAHLIEVTGNSTYCDITLEDDKSTYDLNTLVYDVVTARVSGQSYFLDRTSRDRLDADNAAWPDLTGTPEKYFVTGTSITFYPQPTGDGTVNMTVRRLPVNPMGTSPEIHARHHRRMLDWVYRLAYLKRNSDTYNLQKSKTFEDLFEESFGPRFDAKQQTRQLKRAPTIMKDNAYQGE